MASHQGTPRTQDPINIEGRLNNHVLPEFGDVALARIEPADVRSWVASMNRAGLAPGTVRAYGVLAQVLATAEIDRVIARTPCLGIQLPRDGTTAEMHFLDAG